VSFVPQKTVIRLELKLPQTEATDQILQQSGLDLMSYDRQWRQYRIRLAPDDVDRNKSLLIDLMKNAWEARMT
jgi:hypothetical protein